LNFAISAADSFSYQHALSAEAHCTVSNAFNKVQPL